MSRIRVGIVGIGFGQQVHAPAFRSVDDCEVAAICASDSERAARAASRLGIPQSFGDWRDLVSDPDVDVVSIATPPALQVEIAKQALTLGKPVFCEKPLALTLAQAIELEEIASATGLPTAVDFEIAALPVFQHAENLVKEIGSLRSVHVRWHVETFANRMGTDSWKVRTDEGGGALYSFASHVFRYLEELCGRPINRINATLSRAPGDERQTDTLVTLRLEIEGQIPATVEVCTHAFAGFGHRVEFLGESGSIVIENRSQDYIRGFRLFLARRPDHEPNLIDIPQLEENEDGRVPAVALLARQFITAVQENRPFQPGFREGKRVQELIDAALRSNLQNSWIPCAETTIKQSP